MTNSYDIVVIGAGPAGASAAQAAAQRGAKVLMIDRRQRIGVPVQCAEFVPQWISRYATLLFQDVSFRRLKRWSPISRWNVLRDERARVYARPVPF